MYEDYPRPRPDSGLGVHLGSNAWHVLGEVEWRWPQICQELKQMGISWVKVITAGNDQLSALRPTKVLVEHGLFPVVRFYWSRPYPQKVSQAELENIRRATRAFRDVGVHYFEVDNEPNLIDEWQSEAHWHLYDQEPKRAYHAAETWHEKMQAVVREGGIPLITAMAPGGHHDDELFYPVFLERIRQLGLPSQVGIAAHNYWLNHPLRFPYDPVNQREHPGATLHSGQGMSNGFLKFQWLHEVAQKVLGVSLPVLTTEGGPRIGDAPDRRYPKITPDLHMRYALEQAEFMAKEAPAYYFCTNDWLFFSKWAGGSTIWEEAAWRNVFQGDRPIIPALKARGFVERAFPHVENPSYKIVNVIDSLPKHPSLQRRQRDVKAITRAILHHSAVSPNVSVEAIARYHISADPTRNKALWPGIAYHFYIGPDGTIYQGIALQHEGTHTYANNHDSIGICLAGDFTQYQPTDRQMGAVRWLLAELNITLGRPLKVETHQQNNPTTQCPGKLWWHDLITKDPPAKPEPSKSDLPKINEIRWHSEEAVREIEAGRPEAARERLLTHVIPPLYRLEGQ